jgi:hypothetical protein
MSAAKGQGNTLWIAVVAALLLAGLVLFAMLYVRLPETAAPKPVKTATGASAVSITRIGGDNKLLEQVALYDPKPLFLPTTINNSDPELPASFRREPGRALKSIPPRLTYREYEMNVVLPEAISVPADAVQAVRVGDAPNPFFAFGRVNYPYTPLSPRLALLEVLQSRTGRTVLSSPLQARPADKFPSVDWQPLEMVVAVESSGLVGEPTVTSGSGFEEVDRYFRDLLLQHFRLGARLPPGFYTLRIGP